MKKRKKNLSLDKKIGTRHRRISVHVIARASRDEITEVRIEGADPVYRVRVTAAPERGKANKAVIILLSEHLNIAKSRITIIAGQSDRHKIVEIE